MSVAERKCGSWAWTRFSTAEPAFAGKKAFGVADFGHEGVYKEDSGILPAERLRMGWRPSCLTVLILALSCRGAEGIQPVKSLYTALDFSQCDIVHGSPAGEARLCAGLPGYPVYVAEGQSGTYVSVGPDADKRRAARQTLRAFNTLFDKHGQRSTVEWRFVVRDERPVPYATIVRYFTQSPAGEGEVLVVTRVTDLETCHVAYIDALANLDAIVLARKLADTVARQATCPSEPSVQGAVGRSPM